MSYSYIVMFCNHENCEEIKINHAKNVPYCEIIALNYLLQMIWIFSEQIMKIIWNPSSPLSNHIISWEGELIEPTVFLGFKTAKNRKTPWLYLIHLDVLLCFVFQP